MKLIVTVPYETTHFKSQRPDELDIFAHKNIKECTIHKEINGVYPKPKQLRTDTRNSVGS